MQVFKIKSWKLHYKIELNGKREGGKDQANLKAFILYFYESFKVLTKNWFKDGITTNVDQEIIQYTNKIILSGRVQKTPS